MTTSTTLPAIQVGPYHLRAATEQDRPLLEQWIAADPWHREQVSAEFFLGRAPGEEAWVLEDEHGHVIFYFKTQVACRVHIQFGPATSLEERERNREAMLTGLVWLEGTLGRNHFREIIFDSVNPLLVNSARRRLGFARCPDDLRKAIAMETGADHSDETVHPVSQAQRGV